METYMIERMKKEDSLHPLFPILPFHFFHMQLTVTQPYEPHMYYASFKSL